MRLSVSLPLILVALVAPTYSAHPPARLHRERNTPSPNPSPTPLPVVARDEFTYNPEDTTSLTAITLMPASSTSTSASATKSSVTRATNYTLPKPPTPIPTSPPSPVPTPLDTTMYSLSGACLKYLTNLVASPEFMTCLPFSLLLATSAAFKSQAIDATRSGNYSHMNDLLAYTSHPPDANCDSQFASFHDEISQKPNCAAEFSNNGGQAVARQARRALGNYQVMRVASGLTNPDTGVYCYLEALANDRPDDLYLWGLAANMILPASSKPTCSKCSSLLMDHLGKWAANVTTLNSTVIHDAAKSINAQCGNSFITTIPAPNSKNENSAQRYHYSLYALLLGSICTGIASLL